MKLKIINTSAFLASSLGKAFGLIWSDKVSFFINLFVRRFYTSLYSSRFKSIGRDSLIGTGSTFKDLKYVVLGELSTVGERSTITCYKIENNLNPELIIHDHVSIGTDAHITCSNKIEIGNNVLIGKRVLITDNSHGFSSERFYDTPPSNRNVISKGKVIIEANVWIGNNVSIMPNVHIGEGSIIGANTVVTKNIPPYSLVIGSSSKILE